jgi:hypothetical protein
MGSEMQLEECMKDEGPAPQSVVDIEIIEVAVYKCL